VPGRELLIVRRALATSPQLIRTQLRSWLVAWSWPDDDLDDVVSAADEAVSNVVDHAYRQLPAPGDVHVHARVVTRAALHRVVVSVVDRGRWRPVPADPGYRGRGLRMMGACSAGLRIEHSAAGGTAVTMTSVPVPAGPHPA
jgi:anti-sigma regulatory factor (Ser/Thr protein kinase)